MDLLNDISTYFTWHPANGVILLALYCVTFFSYTKCKPRFEQLNKCFLTLKLKGDIVCLVPTSSWYWYVLVSSLFLVYPLLAYSIIKLIELSTLLAMIAVLISFVYLICFGVRLYKTSRASHPNDKKLIKSGFDDELVGISRNEKKTNLIFSEKLKRTERVNHSILALTSLSVSVAISQYLTFELSRNLIVVSLVLSITLLISAILSLIRKRRLAKDYPLSEVARESKLYKKEPDFEGRLSQYCDKVKTHQTLDKSVLRQLNVMFFNENYDYPSNWQPFVWDFNKLILNFSVVDNLLRKEISGKFVFQSQSKFYIFLLLPFILGVITLISLPIAVEFFSLASTTNPTLQYILADRGFMQSEAIENQDLSLLYFYLALNFLAWMWMSYSNLVTVQIWHYFKYPYSRISYMLDSYDINHPTLDFLSKEKISSEFLSSFLGKGSIIIKTLLLIFLPAYATYVGLF